MISKQFIVQILRRIPAEEIQSVIQEFQVEIENLNRKFSETKTTIIEQKGIISYLRDEITFLKTDR